MKTIKVYIDYKNKLDDLWIGGPCITYIGNPKIGIIKCKKTWQKYQKCSNLCIEWCRNISLSL